MLTLMPRKSEGHLAYRSQSEPPPGRGTLWEDGPMTLEDKVRGLRLQVIRRAQELGNVSQACRDAGIFRALFYRWQKRLGGTGWTGCIRGASGPGPGVGCS